MKDEFLPILEKYHGYGFTTQNAGKFDATVDPIKMARYGIEAAVNNHDISPVKSRIDKAIEKNELLFIYSHKLPSTYTNEDGSPKITVDVMRQILAYVRNKVDNGECLCLSADEAVYQYYKEPIIQ